MTRTLSTSKPDQHIPRILIIKQKNQFREELFRLLHNRGYVVDLCATAREALAKCQQYGFDLVIVGREQNPMDILRNLNMVRNLLAGSRAHIAILTIKFHRQIQLSGFLKGAQHYFCEERDSPQDVMQQVKRILHAQR